MTETEEFEFRHRLEQEAPGGVGAPPTVSPTGSKPAITRPFSWKPEFLRMGEYGNEAGAKVTDFAASVGASPEEAAALGTAANLGVQTVTLGGIGSAVGKVVGPFMEKGAKLLMQSAIKPDKAARTSGLWDKAVTSMLEKGINPTPGAMEAARAKVGTLESEIQAVLEKSPELGDKNNIISAVGKVFKDIRLNPNVVTETKDVNDTIAKFMSHPAIAQYGDKIPVSVINDMKQAFYRAVGEKKYVPGYQVTIEDKTNKALAHGMRGEAAEKVPAVVPTLAEQSELLNILKVAGPQISAGGNKNIVGLGWLSPSMQRTFMWMMDRYPWFKGKFAQAMYSGSERIPAELTAGAIAATQNTGNRTEP